MSDLERDLKAYLDRELNREQADLVREAIDQDPNLALQARQMAAISGHLASKHVPEVEGLADTLAALARRGRTWWDNPRVAWPVALAAVLLAACLIPRLGADPSSTSPLHIAVWRP